MAERQPPVATRFRTIEVEQQAPVCTITLNKPPLNIIDMEMMAELSSVLGRVEESGSGVRVLVLRGAGKAFSAGVSIQEHTPDLIRQMIPRFHDLFRRLARTDRITIAAVHGSCLGGGFELVSMCDLVLAADTAQFGQPEIKLGQLPPVGVILLPYLAGYRKAAELVFSGASIGASEAQALGLVNRVVPQAQLTQALDAMLRELLAHSGSALRLTKQILRRIAAPDFERALDASERFFLDVIAATEDAKEGIFAFLEKRPPRWRNS